MGWRTTLQFAAAAMTAAAISRAADSVRRMIEESSSPGGFGPSPAMPVQFLDSPAPLSASAPTVVTSESDRVVVAQAHDRQQVPPPPHAFGPSLAFAPTRRVGFQPTARVTETPAEETSPDMPIIYRSGKPDPEEPIIAFTEPEASVAEPEAETEIEDDSPAVEEAVDLQVHIAGDIAAETKDDDDEIEAPAVPVRTLRLTAPPIEETPIIVAKPPAAAVMPEATPPHPSTLPATPEPKLVPVAAAPDPAPVAPAVAPSPAKHKHRRTDSALSGTVRSSRGRGLRGMVVSAVDETGHVLATATTGAGGAYVIEGLTAGSFRVVAADVVDGDFMEAWHDGTTLADAAPLKVKEGKTRRSVDLSLPSAAHIDTEVSESKKKVTINVVVTDRATGVPADGTVRIATKLFEVDLPLADGSAQLSIRKTGKSPLHAYGSKVKVSYRGTEHIARASAKTNLR